MGPLTGHGRHGDGWCRTSTRRCTSWHSENKAQAAPTYKGNFGFHPIYCFADAIGDTLGVLLRPGNAAANSISDHVTVLDQAIAGLPAEAAAGHGEGGDPSLVRRPLQRG